MTMETLVSNFADRLAFDALKEWCAILGIDYEEPMTDDEWPNWDGELRSRIATAYYQGLVDGSAAKPVKENEK